MTYGKQPNSRSPASKSATLRPLVLAALTGCAVAGALPLPAGAAPGEGTALALLLAAAFRAEVDPAGYWVSEKLDGVRALWDGRELKFRSGRRIHAPDWFIAALPREPLDGELWLGRGRFDALSGIVRKQQPVDAEWREVRFMVFEAPGGSGGFTERIAQLQAIVARSGTSWLQAIEQFRVAGSAALMKQLDAVVRGGGEGLMLHRADAAYRTGRSGDLMKLKPQLDAEAVVVGHEPGRGRLAGTLGALRLQTPEGREFLVGSGFSDAERRSPPPLGTTVVYRYQELTPAGVPRFPVYWRVFDEF